MLTSSTAARSTTLRSRWHGRSDRERLDRLWKGCDDLAGRGRILVVVRRLAWIALLAAVAVLVAGCGGSRATPTTTRDAPAEGRYVDPLGWSLTYPRTMHLERSRSAGYIDVTVAEVTLASFPVSNPIHSGHTASGSWMRVSPPRSPHGGFPAAGIALRVMRQEGGPAPDVELPESRFPIKLATFGRSSEYPHTTPAALERAVTADGLNYTVQAWIGPKAPTAARSELARVVSSLRFPRPRVGQTIGDGFRVFQPAKRYPVGSFTRVRVAGKPFYLVHAPGGFYAIGWSWETLSGGYKSRCDLRFDSAQKQFSCTNMRARWDRVGRVLAKPVGAKRGDPLNIAVAKLAWDGHVLLNPDVASFADGRLAHQLWPTAHLAPQAGFTSIPGLTMIAASRPSICSGYKGQPPSYCRPGGPLFSTRGSEQVWALTPAVQKYGTHHVPLPIPLPLARRYPGPSYVVVDVFTTPSTSVAKHFLPIYTHTEGYTALPRTAINGGIAARIDSLANDGLNEFRFAWVSGTSMVEVNILGADLTVGEAQRVAHFAHPS